MELIAWVHGVSAFAAGAVIASLWQGMLLAAIVWVCLRLAPKMPANGRFFVWLGAFLAIVALPFLPLVIGHLGGGGSQSASGASAPMFRLDMTWAMGLAGLWVAASLLRAVGLVRNALRLRALWKTAKPVEVDARLQPLLAGNWFRGSAQLCTSAEVDQPCVIGFFSPRVLVPDWLLESATPAELEQIVRHEVAHLRRFDDWTNLAQKLALAVFPLSPGLMWAERRLCSEREAACDESVVRATRAPREYALCLANLAGRRMDRLAGRESAALSLGAWERRSELAGRIYGILRAAESLSPAKARALMAALMVVIAGGAAKLGSTAQLVAFTTEQVHVAAAVAAMPEPEATPLGPRYRDVVFHESSVQKPVLVRRAVVSHPAAHAKKEASSKQVRPQAGPVLLRSNLPMDGAQSWLIVSRWTLSPDQPGPVILIDQYFRISASSAAQSQSGWFVVQL